MRTRVFVDSRRRPGNLLHRSSPGVAGPRSTRHHPRWLSSQLPTSPQCNDRSNVPARGYVQRSDPQHPEERTVDRRQNLAGLASGQCGRAGAGLPRSQESRPTSIATTNTWLHRLGTGAARPVSIVSRARGEGEHADIAGPSFAEMTLGRSGWPTGRLLSPVAFAPARRSTWPPAPGPRG